MGEFDLIAKEMSGSAASENVFDDIGKQMLRDQIGMAKATALSGLGSNPDQAAQANKLGAELGIPGSAVVTDITTYRRQANSQQAAQAIENSPELQRFVTKNPNVADVAGDDWRNLWNLNSKMAGFENRIGKWFADVEDKNKLWRQRTYGKEGSTLSLLGLPDAAVSGFVEGLATGFKKGFGSGGVGAWISEKDRESNPVGSVFSATIVAPLEGAIRLGSGAIVGVADAFGHAARNSWMQATGDENSSERFAREISGVVESYITGLSGAQQPHVSAQKIMRERAGMVERAVDAAINRIVVDEAVRRVDSAQSVANLNSVVDAVAETKLRDRDPLAVEKLLGEHPHADTPIYMSVESVVELYREAGKDLSDKTGPLGFIPDLQERMANAISSGGEVEVAFQKYAANVDPAVNKKLTESLRVGEDSLTLGEMRDAPITAEPAIETASKQNAKDIPGIIANEELRLGIRPLFSEQLPEMTKTLYERYDRLVKEQQIAIEERIRDRVTKEEQRRQGAEWKQELQRVADEVRSDFNSRPDIAAERFLREGTLPTGEMFSGKYKLDTEAVQRLAPDVDIRRYTEKGGHDPDSLAAAFGFDSGTELIRAIDAIRARREELGLAPKAYIERMIANEAEVRMARLHGDLLQNILEAAREGIAGTERFNLIWGELSILAKLAGKEIPFSKADLIESFTAGRERLSVKQARNVKYYERAMLKAGKELENALTKRDWQAAFVARQQQASALWNWKEAKALDKDFNRFWNQIKGLRKKDRVPGIAQDIADVLQDVLKRAGVDVRRDSDSLNKALAEKPAAQVLQEYQNQGYVFQGDPMATAGIPLDQMTTAQYKDFSDFVRSAIGIGRDQQKITNGVKTAELDAARAQATAQTDVLRGKFDPTQNSLFKWFHAGMVRMERLFDWLDLNDPHGVFNTYVFKPLSQSKHWMTDKIRDISADMTKIPAPMEWRRSLGDDIANRVLIDPRSGQPMRINREALIAMALNTGTRSNLKVLAGGYKWDAVEVLRFVDDNMRPQDWKFVQAVWDLYDKHLKDDVERVTKAVSGGVAVKLPVGVTRTLPDGTQVAGKYYPLQKDPLSSIEHTREGRDRFENTHFNPLPTAAALHPRTGATYPLRLDLSGIPGRLRETIHALAYREAMINAAKLLDDVNVRQGITNAFGKDFTALIDPWMNWIARDGGYATESGWGRVAQEVRTNAQAMMLGFNLITPLLHGSGALANSIETVGLFPFIKASSGALRSAIETRMDKFFRNQSTAKSMTEEALGQSGELRNRMHNLDDNFGYVMEKLSTSHGLWELLKETAKSPKHLLELKQTFGEVTDAAAQTRLWFIQRGLLMVAALDQASAIPTWIAARDVALKAGKTLDDAIYAADKAVRNAHGSAGIVDVSAVQRDSVMRNLIMFYNYFNHNLNQLMDTAVTVAKGLEKDRGRGTARFVTERLFYYLVVGAVAHEVLRGHSDDSQNFITRGMMALTGQFTSAYPFLRDIWYSLVSKQKVQVTPIGDVFNTIPEFTKDMIATNRGQPKKKALQHTLELPAIVGLSSRPLARMGQFVWDTSQGRQQVENPADLFRGLAYGESRPRRRH